MLEQVSEEDGARTRTDWAELGSKDEDGSGSKGKGRLREKSMNRGSN